MIGLRKKILPQVFGWMFLGLLITFVSAYVVSINTNMLINIYSGGFYWFFVIVELILAGVLSIKIGKMKGITATCLYLFYTFLTGLTLSLIFVAYEMASIIVVFLVTALLFGIFALIGKFTKIDLSKFGIYLFMGLVGILILYLINIFIANDTIDMIGCILGIIIFLGYVAYDIQRILRSEGTLENRNLAIIGAFSLYLDFINIFIDLLNLFGNSKD